MTQDANCALNRRALTAVGLVVSGCGLPLTGLMVHWTQNQPMTLERHIAMGAHTGLAIAFAIFAVWHGALNRRALANHLRILASRALGVKREAVYAVAVVIGVLFVTVGHAFLLR